MDSFKEFFERLSLLGGQKATSGETIIFGSTDDEMTSSDEIYVDLSCNGVTSEYFDKVETSASLLYAFYETHIANTPVHNALYENALLYKRRTYDDLKLCLLIDVVRCYEGLNHSTSLNSKEGLSLLVLLTKAYMPDFLLTFEGLSSIPERVINLDSLVPYISQCSDEINFARGTSVVSELLQKARPNSDELYREILYRFCENISEVDGEISLSEKEWLMTLLRLDDDDISNDINIDSIFTR